MVTELELIEIGFRAATMAFAENECDTAWWIGLVAAPDEQEAA